MKKITSILSLFILVNSAALYAETRATDCPVDEKSLQVSKDQKTIEELRDALAETACNDSAIFSKSTDLNFIIDHNKTRCEAVDICLAGVPKNDAIIDATEILKDTIPNAILLAAISDEVKNNFAFNRSLNRFEELNNTSVCPEEKIEEKCESDIRHALNSASGSFIDLPKLESGPIASEPLSVFFSKTLLSRKGKVKQSKDELAANCGKKVSFKRICEKSLERSKAVEECEKKKQKGCLDNEQSALASLLNNRKENKDLFLALEKQLCTASRIVPESVSRLTLGSSRPGTFNSMTMSSVNGSISRAPAGEKERSSAGSVKVNSDDESDEEDDGTPSSENINRNGAFQVVDPKIGAPAKSGGDDIKSFEQADGSTLSDQFSKSFNEISQNGSKDSGNNPINTWNNNDVANRFNSLIDDAKKKKEIEDAKKKLEEDAIADKGNISAADRKKNEEMNALLAQISKLKAKLDEMNANVDELKSKKTDDPLEKQKLDKEAQEREKTIADLKKKLSELEADRKKAESENVAKAAESERVREREEARKVSSVKAATAFQNRENERIEAVKREREAKASAYNPSADNYAAAKSASGAGSASGSTLVLKASGVQATPDSAVIYMTISEVQKYPYHLKDNASSAEIESMIRGNNGASIILGTSEQIIPITENGVVQLDEKGNVKFKRVKISLVKSEKERKQSIAREISSIADLKKAEQKQRDLIRYMEMKKAMSKATDGK
ncbi:MAG: hypothetical protein WC635_00955 [Bacteriovorax sp.]|jgi:hypothetical protein